LGDVSVIVPWHWGLECDHRTAALNYVLGRYSGYLLGDASALAVSPPSDGEWCKGGAIRSALPDAREIVIVNDADSWCDGIGEAVQAVREGAPWAVPHEKVHRLTPIATGELLAGCRAPEALATEKRPYRGHAGGGILVARRETLEQVPPDRRFTGWGSEDCAWRDALRTLVGMEWRQSGKPLIHLWHPPVLRDGKHETSPGNHALQGRYVAARGDVEAMRELVAEGAVDPLDVPVKGDETEEIERGVKPSDRRYHR